MTEQRITVGVPDDDPPREADSRPPRWVWVGSVLAVVGGLVLFGMTVGENPIVEAPAAADLTISDATVTTLGVEVLAGLEREADVDLINDLWWRQTNSWAGGFTNGVQFWVDNNYPDMQCGFDDYMGLRYPDGPIEGLLIERIANTATIELDEGWVIPGGSLRGVPARGRVYVMQIRQTTTAPSLVPQTPVLKEVHVTILDGSAHFFFGCL
jgi:hypothetical protein